MKLTLLGLVLVSSISCFGQAGRAEISGSVQDPSHLAVANAKVEAQDQATQAVYSVTSDSRGEYHLLGLPSGQYVLTVSPPGFRTYRQSGITRRLADRVAMDVSLEVGQPAQAVEVVAEAPVLQTESGDVSFSVNQQKVETLPLDG